jgi:hypothetical protein
MLKKIIFYLPLGRLAKATEDSHKSNSRYASSSKQQEGLRLATTTEAPAVAEMQ